MNIYLKLHCERFDNFVVIIIDLKEKQVELEFP
jgi:hypothetical protein